MHGFHWKKVFWILLALCFLLCPLEEAQAFRFSSIVTSPFGDRTNPISGDHEYHPGVDLAAEEGTKIPSLSSGTVGAYYGDMGGGYGNTVEILNDDGSGTLLYAHLAWIPEDVYPGAHVEQGQLIGTMGSTGYSTGPHLHLGYQPQNGELSFASWANPAPFIYANSNWDTEGELDANSIGTVIGQWTQKIIPNIDVDFTKYFSPSEKLEAVTKNVLEKLTPALDLADQHLTDLLAVLCILDFSIFCMLGFIAGRRANPNDMILRLMRYGFFFFLFKGWHTIVSEFFIPMIEDVSSVITGETFSESTFFHFDILFTNLAHTVGPFMHVTSKDFGFGGAILAMAALWILIGLTLYLTFYVMFKLIVFYLLCIFGVLGVPALLFEKSRYYGSNMISSILCAVFDLIMTSWIYVLVVRLLGTAVPLDGTSVGNLVGFTCIWGVFVFFVPSISNALMQTMAALWNGWQSRPLLR